MTPGRARFESARLISSHTLERVGSKYLSMVSGKGALKGTLPCFLRKPFIHEAVATVDRPNRERVTALYLLINRLLTSYMANGDNGVKFSCISAAFGCVIQDSQCYKALGYIWEGRLLPTSDCWLVSSDSPCLSEPNRLQRLSNPKKSERRVFRAGVWV